jgi:hypothetical protein
MDTLPGGLSAPVDTFPVCEWERNDLFVKSPIQVRLVREKRDSGALAVRFSTAKGYFIQPDLMVYWSAGQPTFNNKLPGPAKLLGGFNSGTLPLPGEAAATNGVLVLYSLADNEIVDVSKLIQFHQPTK